MLCGRSLRDKHSSFLSTEILCTEGGDPRPKGGEGARGRPDPRLVPRAPYIPYLDLACASF